MKAIILYDFNVRKTMILNGDNIWELAEPEDELELDSSKEGKEKLNFDTFDLIPIEWPYLKIGLRYIPELKPKQLARTCY